MHFPAARRRPLCAALYCFVAHEHRKRCALSSDDDWHYLTISQLLYPERNPFETGPQQGQYRRA
jgi:hypothetical protein